MALGLGEAWCVEYTRTRSEAESLPEQEQKGISSEGSNRGNSGLLQKATLRLPCLVRECSKGV